MIIPSSSSYEVSYHTKDPLGYCIDSFRKEPTLVGICCVIIEPIAVKKVLISLRNYKWALSLEKNLVGLGFVVCRFVTSVIQFFFKFLVIPLSQFYCLFRIHSLLSLVL